MNVTPLDPSRMNAGLPAGKTGKRSTRTSALVRSVLAFGFVFTTLAGGHLLMVAINALDAAVNHSLYETDGVEARWLGDGTLLAELQELRHEVSGDAGHDVIDGAIQTLHGGHELNFHMLAVSPHLVGMAFGLMLAGLVLIVLSRRAANDAVQSVIGVFAGLLIWTGGAEYGLLIASRVLGVCKGLDLHGERIVGVFGEYVLLKHTWGLILLVAIYLLFLESNRCPFFLWFRKRLKLMRGALITGRIDNFAPRTSFQYITVMWIFYVLLLWAYDDTVFGAHSWLTYAIFFGSFASAGYLLLRLFRQRTMGAAVRYAIATSIVCWNPIEIAAKWGVASR